jgi:hypothetical protein
LLLPLLRAALAVLQFSLGLLTLPLGVRLLVLQGPPRLLSLSLSLTLLVLQLSLGLPALPLALYLALLHGPLRPLSLSLSFTLLVLQLALVLAVLGRWFRCLGRPRRPLVRSSGHRGGILSVGVLLAGLHQQGPSGSMWAWSEVTGRPAGDPASPPMLGDRRAVHMSSTFLQPVRRVIVALSRSGGPGP